MQYWYRTVLVPFEKPTDITDFASSSTLAARVLRVFSENTQYCMQFLPQLQGVSFILRVRIPERRLVHPIDRNDRNRPDTATPIATARVPQDKLLDLGVGRLQQQLSINDITGPQGE